MAGHNKWSKIKRKKEANDKKKSKDISKALKMIKVAIKDGGNDPSSNHKLSSAISFAKSLNITNSTIENALVDDKDLEVFEILYEAYGYGGVGFIINSLTDNKNRSAASIRSVLNRHSKSLSKEGAVSYLFNTYSQLGFKNSNNNIMNELYELDVKDIDEVDDLIIVTTKVDSLESVKKYLEDKGIKLEIEPFVYIPDHYIDVCENDYNNNVRLLEDLEDLEDVSNVYHNMKE